MVKQKNKIPKWLIYLSAAGIGLMIALVTVINGIETYNMAANGFILPAVGVAIFSGLYLWLCCLVPLWCLIRELKN